jgi:hypothetical protein
MLHAVVSLGFMGTVTAIPPLFGLSSKPFVIGFFSIIVGYAIFTILKNRTRIPNQTKILSILDSELENYTITNPFQKKFMVDNVDLSEHLAKINNPNIRIFHKGLHIFIIESGLPSLSLHDRVMLFSVDNGRSWYENAVMCSPTPIYAGKNISFVINKLKGEAKNNTELARILKKQATGTVFVHDQTIISRSINNSLKNIKNVESYTIDINTIDFSHAADLHNLSFHKDKFFEKHNHLKDLPLELIIPLHF